MPILVTNNILVKTNYENTFRTDYREDSLYGVLIRVRDYIHDGHILLTHPLSGSVKPNETPYKSVLISDKSTGLDHDSLNLIESAAESIKKFPPREIPEQYLPELREVDFTLIRSALNNHLS